MGAWDCGLLDNDCAQDWIGAFARQIELDVIAIHENKSRKLAGNLSAAVGILLRLAHCFDPIPGLHDPPHFYPRLLSALSANFTYILEFSGDAPKLLGTILAGGGSQLTERPAELTKPIKTCLFGGQPGVLQGGFSRLETDLFSNPSARTYMVRKSQEIVKQIDSRLKDHDDVLDMSYTSLGGMIGLLLVLPFQKITAKKIAIWKNKCHAIWHANGSDDRTNDIEFERGFRENVDSAFRCASKIYK